MKKKSLPFIILCSILLLSSCSCCFVLALLPSSTDSESDKDIFHENQFEVQEEILGIEDENKTLNITNEIPSKTTENNILISGTVPQNTTSVNINSTSVILTENEDHKSFSETIPIETGENRILVTVYSQDEIIIEREIITYKFDTAYVSSIVDGDTIKISRNGTTETVRLIGIDTPESVHPNKPVECFSLEATEYLTSLINEKTVIIEFDDSQGTVDKYNRLLLYIWIDENLINEKMIKDGYAYEYTYSTPYKYQQQFKDAEQYATDNNLGLWGNTCACEKGTEISRVCSGCKSSTVTKSNWDCSTYTEKVTDNSCTTNCPIYTPPPVTTEYTCNCKKTCTQITTCEEAYYQLNECGCNVRDGDDDGVPCENLCPGG